jgi:hypothetical protein
MRLVKHLVHTDRRKNAPKISSEDQRQQTTFRTECQRIIIAIIIIIIIIIIICEFRFPPRCKPLGFHAGYRPTGLIYKATHEYGTDRLSRNVVYGITTLRCVKSQNISDLTNIDLEDFTVQVNVAWYTIRCSWVDCRQSRICTCCLHLQGRMPVKL